MNSILFSVHYISVSAMAVVISTSGNTYLLWGAGVDTLLAIKDQ